LKGSIDSILIRQGTRIQAAISTGVLFGFTWMTVGCQPKTASPFIVPVSAKKIQTRNFEEVIQAQGTLSNPGYIQITPQINGLITQVLVKEGDAVNAGDILMTLNNKQELAELKTAKEELKQHIIEAKNTNYLVNNGAKPYIEIEQKRVEVVRAKSHMVAKQEALDKKSIRSPINGVVGDLFGISPGQYMQEGEKTNLYIVNNENLSIYLSIPALQAKQIKLNQQVKMYNETNSDVIGTGKITFIPPYFNRDSANKAANTLGIKADFINEKTGLRPAQLIRSKIIIGSKQLPSLPATATLFKAQQPYTYQLVPIKTFLKTAEIDPQQKQAMSAFPASTYIARETALTLGSLQDDHFPILSGLKSGDLIATSGSGILSNGSPVSIRSEK
tara:strand:+ start:3014 stop:4177 length:1164 start_codon:yes stop_codon:yes gene_type:complete